MSTGYFNDPNQYASYLMQYISRSSYYTYDEKPLVTTFGVSIYSLLHMA